MSIAMRCSKCKSLAEVAREESPASSCQRCGGDLVQVAAEETVAFPPDEAFDEPFDEEDAQALRPAGFDPVGMEVGGCRIESLIAKGGMGAVYRGHHLSLDIPVAIKVLTPGLHREADNAVDRFIRAAQIAARLKHQNIVGILNVGEEEGLLYLVMEYVDGDSLEDLLRDGALGIQEGVEIALQLAEALSFAAEQSIVHRDIKPANVLVSKKGRVKLADLGLARDLFLERSATQTGMVMGTVHYMSAEQAEDARKVDIRSDIYSFGITLFEMLTGQVPYENDSLFKIMDMHLRAKIPNPQLLNPKIPSSVAWIIRKCMAKKPAGRYPNPEALIADLRAALSGGAVEAEQEAIRAGWAEGDLSRGQRILLRTRRGGGRLAWAALLALRTAVLAGGAAFWYVMFMQIAHAFPGKGRIRFEDLAPEKLLFWTDRILEREWGIETLWYGSWGWQELLILGVAATLVGNLIPRREKPKPFALSRRFCGIVLFYLGALLIGFGMSALGIGISLGGGLLLLRIHSGDDDVVSRISHPSTRGGTKK
ncbi:MAG: serine/threonine-protein kinase [Planctomycetota bacterium]|jgi:tRNA A-37 threonylcarbamoyl transferase component Bud32